MFSEIDSRFDVSVYYNTNIHTDNKVYHIDYDGRLYGHEAYSGQYVNYVIGIFPRDYVEFNLLIKSDIGQTLFNRKVNELGNPITSGLHMLLIMESNEAILTSPIEKIE